MTSSGGWRIVLIGVVWSSITATSVLGQTRFVIQPACALRPSVDDWDLGGSGGFEGGDGDDGGVFGIDAGWYPSERLRFGVEGSAGTAEIYGGEASIQWQPFDSTSNWVIGVHGGGGSFDGSHFYSTGIGVLYHYAAPKSLKRQLREDRL